MYHQLRNGCPGTWHLRRTASGSSNKETPRKDILHPANDVWYDRLVRIYSRRGVFATNICHAWRSLAVWLPHTSATTLAPRAGCDDEVSNPAESLALPAELVTPVVLEALLTDSECLIFLALASSLTSIERLQLVL